MDVKICFYSNNLISLILATLWFPYSNKHAVTQKLKAREAHLNKVQKERKPLIPHIHHSIVISLLTQWYFFHYFLTSVKGSAITHRIQSCQKCQNLHQRDMESTNVTVCVYIKRYLRDLFFPAFTSSCLKAGCAYLCSHCHGWWIYKASCFLKQWLTSKSSNQL